MHIVHKIEYLLNEGAFALKIAIFTNAYFGLGFLVVYLDKKVVGLP